MQVTREEPVFLNPAIGKFFPVDANRCSVIFTFKYKSVLGLVTEVPVRSKLLNRWEDGIRELLSTIYI